MPVEIQDILVDKVSDWMGIDNIIWFKHVKGLKGTVNAVLKLNFKRKHLPVHPIHFREGMQIRNFMRAQMETQGWSNEDYDNNWSAVIEKCILKL